MYKRGRYLRIIIAIFITVMIAGACAPKNSNQTMMTNDFVKKDEVSDASMPNQIAADPTVLDTDMQLTQENEEQIEFSLSAISSEELYILPESDSRFYTENEISALSKEQLRLARNEIYARHGRKFTAADLQHYFTGKSWYSPLYEADDFDAQGDIIFNEFESANILLIIELEEKFNYTDKPKINYIGNYVVQGDLYIWVNTYYIQDNILYVEGELCDGIPNPYGEAECDMIDFVTINSDIKVRIDNKTFFSEETTLNNIYDLKETIDAAIYWFGSTSICVQLEGDYVSEYFGNWQSS